VLAELFARTADMIVAILRRYADEASIQCALALFLPTPLGTPA
jgi:hypothetical protein